MKRAYFFLVLGLAVIIVAGHLLLSPSSISEANPPTFPRDRLTIERADGKAIPFTIEVATTEQQHAYGLMFRHSLPQEAGMLFLFTPPQPVVFWMKNTLIPLDMLFVREDGTIAKIAPQAVPEDRTIIASGETVSGVLEINGGEAGQLGIKVGDKIHHPAFTAK